MEILKSEDVQQADGQQGGPGGLGQVPVDDAVDCPNNPDEEFIVNCLELNHTFNPSVAIVDVARLNQRPPTLTKASLPFKACLELSGLLTLSLAVVMERLVRLESSRLFLTFRGQA